MNGFQQNSFAKRFVEDPEARLPAFSSPRWRLRFRLADLAIALRSGRDAMPGDSDIWQICGICGHAAFTIDLPAALLDAFFARAPDPVTLDTLTPEDAAILLEHLFSGPLAALEAKLERPVIFQEIFRRESRSQANEIPLVIELQGESFPVALALLDGELRKRLHGEVARMDASGPDGVPGMAVAVGPILLSRLEVAGLMAGDQLVLDGASIERLQGGVFLDDRLYWPSEILGNVLEVSGPLVSAPILADERSAIGPLSLFFHVGLTGEASSMHRGDRMSLQRLDDSKMMLKLGARVIGRAALVKLPEGIAVRLIERENA